MMNALTRGLSELPLVTLLEMSVFVKVIFCRRSVFVLVAR
jgi:hypothetical protein